MGGEGPCPFVNEQVSLQGTLLVTEWAHHFAGEGTPGPSQRLGYGPWQAEAGAGFLGAKSYTVWGVCFMKKKIHI